MSLVKSARAANKKGDYLFALKCYEELKAQLSTTAFDLNISQLQKSLNLVQTPNGRPIVRLLQHLGVQRVYVLNMVSKPDRRLRIARELYVHGVHHYTIVDGVEGYADSKVHDLLSAYLNRPCGSRNSSAHIAHETQIIMKKNASIGTFGYLVSQKKIFEDAKENGWERICVFDDDMLFCEQADLICEAILNLGAAANEFKILHLGASEYSEKYPCDRNEPASPKTYNAIPHRTCGSFATIYDLSIYNEILSGIEEADGPFDNVTLGAIYNKYPDQCVVVAPNLCLADVQTSSIRNGRDQAQHSARMQWLYSASRYSEYVRPHAVNIVVRDLTVARNFLRSRVGMDEGWTANIFYCSSDGLRPLHTESSDIHNVELAASNRVFDEMSSLCNGGETLPVRLPASDLCILWPSAVPITNLRIQNIIFFELYGQASHKRWIDAPYLAFESNFASRTDSGLATVIMPMARAFELVKPSIDSVISQDYERLEFILVVDSPSSGIDLNFIRTYIETKARELRGDKYFKFLLIQHRQVRYGCGARNTGLFASAGGFVSYIDDDDLYTSDRVSKAVSFLQNPANAKFSACYCGFTGLWSKDEGNDLTRYREGNLFYDLIALNYKRHFVHTGTMTYRAESIFAILGFDEKYKRHQDIELNGRFFRAFVSGCVKEVGMVFKPNRSKIKPTVHIDFALILRIKRYLIEDFAAEVSLFSTDEMEEFFDHHADDIISLTPQGSTLTKPAAVDLLRSFMKKQST